MAFSFLSDIAPTVFFDFGSYHTTIFQEGKGVVVSEETAVCFDAISGQILFHGKEAMNFIDAPPPSARCVKPIQHGLIADGRALELLLTSWKKHITLPIWTEILRPRAIVSVPSNWTSVHARVLRSALHHAGFGEVVYIPSLVALTAQAGLTIVSQSQCVLDGGYEKIDVGIVHAHRVQASHCVKLGLQNIEDALCSYIHEFYSLEVSGQQIHTVLQEVTLDDDKEHTLTIRGKDRASGDVTTHKVKSGELRLVCLQSVEEMARSIDDCLIQLDADQATHLRQQGMILGGGLSQLQGIDTWLSARLHTYVTIIERSAVAPVLGLAKLVQNDVVEMAAI